MAKLHILNGPNRGMAFSIQGNELSIGRSPKNDIQVEGLSVSRRHAKLIFKDDRFYIKDLKSKNGVYINGTKAKAGVEEEIFEGQLITLGRIAFSITHSLGKNENSLTQTLVFPEEISEKERKILESIDLSSLLTDGSGAKTADRPNTSEKNVELIYNVSSILMKTLENNKDINKILRDILNSILNLLKRIDRGVFILIDENSKEIKKILPLNKKSKSGSEMFSRTIVNRVLQDRKPVIMLDTLNEDESDLSDSMVTMSIRSVMCVPLISSSKIRGVLYVDSLNRPYGFRSEDLFLLNALSVPAAYALERASF